MERNLPKFRMLDLPEGRTIRHAAGLRLDRILGRNQSTFSRMPKTSPGGAGAGAATTIGRVVRSDPSRYHSEDGAEDCKGAASDAVQGLNSRVPPEYIEAGEKENCRN